MDAPRPFFLYALPRSRTAWLANALTYGAMWCGHELSPAGVPALAARLSEPGARFRGVADTGLALRAAEVAARWPAAPRVVIRRPEVEVVEALHRCGARESMETIRAVVRRLAAALEEVARQPGTLTLAFAELDNAAVGQALWAHVAPGEAFESERWRWLTQLQVQLRPGPLRALLGERSN